MRKTVLTATIWDAAKAVLPVSVIIFVVACALRAPVDLLVRFVLGDVLLVLGLALFTIGSDASIIAIAESIGEDIVRRRRLFFFIFIAFLVGFLVTVAEPALWVLAGQFKSVLAESRLIIAVAVGVGLFFVIGLLRVLTQHRLVLLFAISYAVLFLIAGAVAQVNPGFIPVAFDSGGATTGPMAVPFIIALGYGISKSRGERGSEEDSFGLVGIASIGPILSVLILGLFVESGVPESEGAGGFGHYFVEYVIQMGLAILPFVLFFGFFQVFAFRFGLRRVLKILIAFVYTYAGLVLFLTGANAGLVNMGNFLGEQVGALRANGLLVPLGMLFGFTVVAAEPSVVALNRQVETVSAGAIPRRFMMIALSTGVSIAVGLACMRVLSGLSIWWVLLPGYGLTILLSFFTPRIFMAIAFDSGGAVSGAMTSAFLVPYALGAAHATGGDILTDAFGLVAFVAMTPLITIQLLGWIFKTKMERLRTRDETGKLLQTLGGQDETLDINRPEEV